MQNIKKILVMLFVSFGLTAFVSANDSSGSILPSGNIKFEKQKDIVMLQESLFLSKDLTEVNYLFKNISDKDITVKVFFPVPEMVCYNTDQSIDSDYGYEDSQPIDFNVWVNGKKVSYKTHFNILAGDMDITKEVGYLFRNYYTPPNRENFINKIDMLPENIQRKIFFSERDLLTCDKIERCSRKFNPDPSLVCSVKVSFYWEQTFPAGETVHVKHIYTPAEYKVPHVGWNDSLRYILKTANNWQTPIHQFNSLILYHDSMIAEDIKGFIPVEDISVDAALSNKCLGHKAAQTRCPGTCTLFRGKGHEPVCVFNKEEIETIIWNDLSGFCVDRNIDTDKIKWNKRGSYFTKLNGIIAKETEHDYYRKYLLSESSAEELKKLLSCKEYFEKRYGKYNITPKLYQIDGPANIRETPNGQKIVVFEDKTYVWAVSQKGDWFDIIQGEIRGWTHKDNLVDIWAPYQIK
jgi:hypothetical protein